MYWESCIKRRDCYYRTSPIGYWGKGSTVGWYKVDMAKQVGWVRSGRVNRIVGQVGFTHIFQINFFFQLQKQSNDNLFRENE